MLNRETAVALANKQLFDTDYFSKESHLRHDEYWGVKVHYGVCELRELFDAIYDSEPSKESEKIGEKYAK